jgi:hypothetical protein
MKYEGTPPFIYTKTKFEFMLYFVMKHIIFITHLRSCSVVPTVLYFFATIQSNHFPVMCLLMCYLNLKLECLIRFLPENHSSYYLPRLLQRHPKHASALYKIHPLSLSFCFYPYENLQKVQM